MLSFGAAAKRLVCLGLAAGLVSIASFTQSVGAASTRVQVAVCGDDASGSTITIDSPVDNSTVTTNPTRFEGVVSFASQIDITIDGSYAQTVPINPNQGSYAANISLTPGQHTIELVANDICGIESRSASLNINYDPPDEPLPPTEPVRPDTPKPSDGQVDSGGASTGGAGSASVVNKPVDNTEFHNPFGYTPVGHAFEFVIRSLDLDVVASRSGLAVMIRDFMMVVTGLFLMIFGPAVYSWLVERQVKPGLYISQKHRYIGVLLRLVGLGLFVGALFL